MNVVFVTALVLGTTNQTFSLIISQTTDWTAGLSSNPFQNVFHPDWDQTSDFLHMKLSFNPLKSVPNVRF